MTIDLPPPPRARHESAMSHALTVLPGDTAKPILDALNGASDAGLLADLAKRDGGAEKLGIVDHHDRDHKKKH